MSFKPRDSKSSKKRRVTAAVASVISAASLFAATPAVATAQANPFAGVTSSVPSFNLNKALADINKQTRDNAWNTRNRWIAQAKAALPAPQAKQAERAIDGAINALFPGLIAERKAEIAARERAAKEAAARKAKAERERKLKAERARKLKAERARFNTGPCPVTARACVDIAGGRSWIQENGRVVHMAPSSAARPGYDTPKGQHYVTRKVKDEVSYLYNMAPMPNAVYFTNNGHAFHAGVVGDLSHGCIHLNYDDSVVFFNSLNVGDSVYIY